MDTKTFIIYLVVMAGVTYLIRAVPFVMVNKKIENMYIKSFFNYIPYTVLAAMTVPRSILFHRKYCNGGSWIYYCFSAGIYEKEPYCSCIISKRAVFAGSLIMGVL